MKKQLKKSLSLFLAVLMLMSCWVWVAPQKAEAGAPTNYTVTVDYEIMACCTGNEAPDTSVLVVDYITNNGTGTSSSSSKDGGNLGDKEGVTGSLSLDVAGWPSSVKFEVRNNSLGKYHVKVLSIKINGMAVCTGKWVLERTASSGANSVTAVPNSTGNANADGLNGTITSPGASEDPVVWDWSRPKLNATTAALDTATHTLAKVNTGINSVSTISLSGFFDHYGVNWTGTLSTTFKLRVDEGITLGSNATITGSGNSRTVTIKPWFQTLYPGKQNAKIYIDWTATGGPANKSGTEIINIDFPTYTATFYANGDNNNADAGDAQIGADAYTVDADGVIEHTHDKMNYGSVIGEQPGYAYRPGFEFKGYYSKDNNDALGKDTNFAGTKFEDKVTTVPHTLGASYGYDSNASYFDNSKFIGDTKWFAAWQAAPFEVTFLTADNQLISTLIGRHNNKMTAENMYNGLSGLNAAVKAAYTGTTVQFNGNDEPIYKDGGTTFEFAGWKIIDADDESVIDSDEDTILTSKVTFQATYTKADAATYTVIFKDRDGSELTKKSGYKYRDDVTNVPADVTAMEQDDVYSYEFIGWAKDIGKNFYTVDASNKDEGGALINYTHKDLAEFTVKGDATYVPVYRMIPREYTVTYSYKLDGNITESVTLEGFHWHDTPTMPEIKDNYTNAGQRNYIVGWKVNNTGANKQLDEILVTGNMSITAAYGNAEAAKYIINFYGKDVDGETDIHLNPDSNIYEHGMSVTAPEYPETIDTADSLYTFRRWNPGIAGMASGDREYYAEYTKKDYADVYFYNYDGTLIYKVDGKESQLFVGDRIPVYTNTVDGVNVLPSKEEDAIGTYEFTGWANGNGEAVRPGRDTLAGDLYLYAQFETEYKEYEVKFLDDDGTEISNKKYRYGAEIEIPVDPTKAADKAYIYDFRAWTPDVSEICGGDATYTATYRRTPRYYEVTWLKDDKSVLSESNYAYDAKIQQAIVDTPVDYPDAGIGKTWAFKHWVQCDADGNDILVDGNQVLFIRGQRMPAEHLYFYPVFEAVDNILTVTFYKEDGISYLGQAAIPYGKNILEYADTFAAKAPKVSDADYHYIIKEWVDIKTGAVVETIEKDISVKATYTAEAHAKQLYEVVAEPTCNIPGYAHYKCDVVECTAIDYNVSIPPVADTSKPTGQIYVGDTKWTFENYADGIDYDVVKYVGPKTSLVVNAEDTGTRSMPWNLEGTLCRGVGKIEYNVSTAAITNPATIDMWTEIYNYEETRQDALQYVLEKNNITLVEYTGFNFGTAEEKMAKAGIDREVDAMLANYKANATGIVSNLNLKDGQTYVIYIKVSDREGTGEVNVAYFSSGTISYGAKSPEISVEGEGYGTKFCNDAVITVTDDTAGVRAYVDGTEIALSESGTYNCDEKGLHTLEAIDIHGNKTTKIFEIKGSHTYRNYTIVASCEGAGSRYDLCTDCGAKANEEVLSALGHSYTANYVDKAPDCVTDGYRTYTCDNNCGTKLVLNPTDAAEELAKADLTADDLKHLKATGKHTYTMVKGENGEDTAEYVWVIDKAANCNVKGSKHRDCIVCGNADARVTEEIPQDLENGHNFYRVKVTKEPTCTEKGEKTKACKYCGTVEFVEYVPALGHTEGEYRVITGAACEAVGSKILTCSACGIDIGEPIKDDKGNVTGFDGKAVEIAELGHAYEISDEVYEKDGKYWQKYVCKNNAEHTYEKELPDYEPPVEVTVTFDFNGGYYTIPAVGNPDEFGYVPEMIKGTQTIKAHVGETIIATDIETALKQNNATKTYTFSHWADADGKEVKFPIEVKGDATYYAVFAERYINYTITYYKEDGITEFKKTGYLHNGEEVTLADGPAKAEDWQYAYEFAGWAVINSDPEVVYTDKVTIDGANINLKAKYVGTEKKYAVTYAYSSNNQIHTYTVEAGSPAPDVRNDFEVSKAYDAKYHYTFKEWNRAAQLVSVQSNIYTTPNFEAASHDYEKTATDAPACGVNEIYTWTCKVCGHSYQEEKTGTALEHLWSEPAYNEESGKNTVKCQREGCGVTQEDTRSFTVKFFLNEGDIDAIKTISYIPWGTTIGAIRLPADPMKEATSEYTYKFKGWAVKGTTDIVNVAEIAVKADAEYVAIFEATIREYTVTFAYDAYNVIKVVTGVKAGENVTYTGATPTKKFDDNYHYTFSGWSGVTTNILKDTYVTAQFSRDDHDNTPSITAATCTTGEGTVYTCTCGYRSSVVATSKPLGHAYEEVIGTRVEPKDGKDGSVTMKCSRCSDSYVKVLPWTESGTPDTPATPDKVVIRITVRDQYGNGVPGATVALYQNSNWVARDITNANGVVAFEVAPGKYTAVFTGVKYSGDEQTEITVDGKGNVSGNIPSMYINDCGCACHRDNLWGKIFRFFHKIIKMLTGEFKCCKDPSDLY